MSGDAIVARARACLGVRFRPQGRSAAFGLDCAGLVLVALGPAATELGGAANYALSGTGLAARAEAGLSRIGAERIAVGEPGDIMLFEPARAQGHLAVISDLGVIQAHLGVRRVVEGPADPAWAIRSIWRFEAGE